MRASLALYRALAGPDGGDSSGASGSSSESSDSSEGDEDASAGRSRAGRSAGVRSRAAPGLERGGRLLNLEPATAHAPAHFAITKKVGAREEEACGGC